MGYNINELLDKRKHDKEKLAELARNELDNRTFFAVKEVELDKDGKEKLIKEEKPVAAKEFFSQFSEVLDEIASATTAITKYNATVLKDLLAHRDAVREKIRILKVLKQRVPIDSKIERSILAQSKEGEITRYLMRTHTPLFERKEVEKMADEFAKEERKLNTEIQKLNLEQKIEL